MTEWTEGYITEIEYTRGYYRELSPNLQRFALLAAGYAQPPEEGAYLELGYGQGLALAIHAAATPYEFWGTDFNPSHAAHADSLLKAAGVVAWPFDDSFADFAERRDLPKFQYAGMHGVWSWISNENRAHIASILRHNLVPGASLYISYNTLPGWSASLSLRDLLTLHAETAGAESQGIAGRIDAAVAFAEDLVAKGAAYFRVNPGAVERLKQISQMNRHYLAHEYFNRDWDPMPFSTLAEWLRGAKLEFAGSAHILDQIDAVNLQPEAQAVVKGITHPILRESVRDFFTNQQFRRDLFVRGARRLTQLERQEALAAARFALTVPAENIPMTVNATAGEVQLQEPVYRPIIELFAKNDYRAMSLSEIARALPKLPPPQVLEAMSVLVGVGNAQPAQSEATIEKVTPRVAALNRELMRRARGSEEMQHLASPVIGGGVAVARMQQMFLLARANGSKTPADWAKATWAELLAQGQRMIREGKPVESPDENIAELTSLAKAFADRYLPILIALGVA